MFHGTLDGSLGILVPTDKESFDTLQKLQDYLVTRTPQPCGLNSKSFRVPKTAEGRPTRQNAPNLFLDGDTLAVFEQAPLRPSTSTARLPFGGSRFRIQIHGHHGGGDLIPLPPRSH